jgi:RNA polymerase sigma-70 factor, ECF subfamily
VGIHRDIDGGSLTTNEEAMAIGSSGAWHSGEGSGHVAIDGRSHDVPTLKQIFDNEAPFVWRTLRYLGVAPSDLQDVCQEVFLVVHRRLGEFEGRSSIKTWLYQICLRSAAGYRRRAHMRHEKVMADPPEQATPNTPSEALDEHVARELLHQVLDSLDPIKREVFVLYEIEERPMSEIAEVIGCPLRTAYSRLETARKELMKAWERSQVRSRRP